ncbi:hypothetical protein HHK36_010190 [Tetracentron sinense]|uniref:Uncharacterized protein n=1 Tax=Tetracentron sinense TaxID=13715 RepID=A0A835DI90_TETSI|nr:hypothetical protein HHK36_010190 [Tetracentron sinense]
MLISGKTTVPFVLPLLHPPRSPVTAISGDIPDDADMDSIGRGGDGVEEEDRQEAMSGRWEGLQKAILP